MDPSLVPRDLDEFGIAVICALELEAECVIDVLDNIWKERKYEQVPSDENAYTFGSIGKHNVVVVHMPGMGTDRTAFAMSALRSSFRNIELALVVGVCGGMPYGIEGEEIILGDVIISELLIRYDFGRQYPQGFVRKSEIQDILGPHTEKVRAFLAKLKTRQNKEDIKNDTSTFLHALQLKSSKIVHPGTENDILYHSSYGHQHRSPLQCNTCNSGNETCLIASKTGCEALGCDPAMRVARTRLTDSSTTHSEIHFGVMGCGNTVMKSAHHRDALAQKDHIIAVEMEGAGAWRYGPTLIIKGVCDYADSHKRKGWQIYAAATAAACMKALLLQWKSAKHQNFRVPATSINEYFLVPNRRVKKFFGRENELLQIASYFDSQPDRPRTLVLYAMGGQGKTQTALQYCESARRTYRGVFWVDGASIFTMTQSLVGIAEKIDRIAVERLPDDAARVDFVLRTLQVWEQRWLMVFDNCDDIATFPTLQDKMLPRVGQGDILMTTRQRAFEELADLVVVQPMPHRAGVGLLLHRYDGANIEHYLAESTAIVERLGNLPLAIDQASAYMHSTRLPLEQLSSFLPKYTAERKQILQHTTQNFWKYTKVVTPGEREVAINAFATWEMSLQQFLDSEPAQDHLSHFLTLSAFMASTYIHETLFRNYQETLEAGPAWISIFTMPSSDNARDSLLLRPVDLPESSAGTEHINARKPRAIWNTEYFWRIINQAFQMSLVQNISPATDSEGASFLLHPLIRDWLQLRLNIEDRQAYTREVQNVIPSTIARCVNIPRNDTRVEPTILLHMDSALLCDNEFFDDQHRLGKDTSTIDIASLFAHMYDKNARYATSVGLRVLEVDTRERTLGTDTFATLVSKRFLVDTLTQHGDYTRAREIGMPLLEAMDRLLGETHLETQALTRRLGTALFYLGNLTEATNLNRRMVEVSRRTLGEEHIETLMLMNCLALVLHTQGKIDEAEEIFGHIIEPLQRMRNEGDPGVASYALHLASILELQGRYSAAEKMYRDELKFNETILGKDHPTTLMNLSKIAMMLRNQHKYSDAEQIFYQVMTSRERVLGKEHPYTLASISGLAEVLRDQKNYRAAEQLYRQVINRMKRLFGQGHLETLCYQDDLVNLLIEQQKWQEAEIILLDYTRAILTPLDQGTQAEKTLGGRVHSLWRQLGWEESKIQRMVDDTSAIAGASRC